MTNRAPCPGCAIADDHPRHQAVTGSGAVALWHTDCHASYGCPVCTIARDGAEELRGQEYREHLLENGDTIQAAIEALDPTVHNQVFERTV